MSRSKPNSEALDLQQRSLALQEQQAASSLSFMEQQLQALRKTQVADYKPLAPPPTPGTSGADFAAAQQRIINQRRYNYSDTVRGGVRFGVGRKVSA